ncbi:golgi uridine diphosphate-N-acetylglucosamine transporter [Umbelopsis sp. WA50703]
MSAQNATDTRHSFVKSLLQLFANEYILILSLIFGGCCSNVFALEILVNDAPKSGQLITLGQFLFVAMEGLLYHVQWPSPAGTWWPTFLPSLKPRAVPIQRWVILVVVFYLVSALNNIALGFNISMPLHIIFRSGGLIVNMIMGWLLLNKRYSMGQITAVVLVTIGVVWATIASTSVDNKKESASSGNNFALGIVILSVAMVLSACLGLLQEVTYRKYGKCWREGLFYTHCLSLPIFLFFYKDLLAQLDIYNRSPLVSPLQAFDHLPIAATTLSAFPFNIISTFKIPKLWYYLIMDVLTQYVCISGVNRMTAVSSSLTLNLVLNLRKFTSLVISIVYFNNPFAVGAAYGSVLVFIGTILYTQSPSLQARSNTGKKSQ